MSLPPPDMPDQPSPELVRFGRHFIGGAAAASLAALLTIVALDRHDPWLERAVVTLALGLPLLFQHVVLIDDPRPYRLRTHERLLPIAGVLLSLVGFGMLLGAFSRSGAVAWAAGALIAVYTVTNSQRRAGAALP